MPTTTHEIRPTSFLVTVAARAISSVGFGVSLVALWVVWLFPAAAPAPAPDAVVAGRKSFRKAIRRRSAPPTLQTTSTVPVPVPILHKSNKSLSQAVTPFMPSLTKRVYFLDEQIQSSLSCRNSLDHRPPTQTPIEEDAPSALASDSTLGSKSFIYSLPSSSSTLVTASQAAVKVTADPREESPVESDNSSVNSSSRLAVGLPKILSSKKRSKFVPTCSNDNKPTTDVETIHKHARRSSTSNCSSRIPFLLSRVASPSTSTVAPEDSLGYFSRQTSRPQRRVSTPTSGVPRTQPYDYPYFAPTPLFPDENWESERDGREAAIRERKLHNAAAQSLLGPGRPVRRSGTIG